MNVQIHANPASFLSCAQGMLEIHESVNNLILGAVLRLAEYPDWVDSPPYLATIEDEHGQPALAASIMPPRNLLLAADPMLAEDKLGDALAALIQRMIVSVWPVPGVLAEKVLADQFARAWGRSSGKSSRLKTRERIYELHQVIPPQNLPAGHLRLATQQDSGVISQWLLAFSLEALGQGNLTDSQKQATRLIGAGNIYLWENQGPVSMAARARPTPHGCTVTGVYTPLKQRGKGYASACVAALSQLILSSGKLFCNLYTDLSNPTSNAIYQKIGYRPVCDFNEYVFEY